MPRKATKKKNDALDMRIREIIGDTFCIDDQASVTLDAKLGEDLGADSMDVVELVICLEEEYGIEIPDDDAEQCITVRQVVNMIKRLHPVVA